MLTLNNEIRQAIFDLVNRLQGESLQNQRDFIQELFCHFLTKMQQPLVLEKADIEYVISESKRIFSNETIPVFDRYPVDTHTFASICTIEAFIGFLNSKNALNRTVFINKKTR